MDHRQITLGKHSLEEWEDIIGKASDMADIGVRIQFLSDHFLDIGYAESTLIGDSMTPEVFVINLQGLDCMTFIESVAAMSRSSSFAEFSENLKKVRYKSGIVDYSARNHFFTDWKANNAALIDDVTERIGGIRTARVLKKINEKEDGTGFLQGIQPVNREIIYIPSYVIDGEVIDQLKTGDYIGIFSSLQGLDVSHTGLIARHEDIVYLRHASSQRGRRRVIDQDFREYVGTKPGILVLRPKAQQ